MKCSNIYNHSDITSL